MDTTRELDDLRGRLGRLERQCRRQRAIFVTSALALAALAATAAQDSPQDLRVRTLTADRVAIADHQGRTRILLAEDPPDGQRRSRGCGLTVYDAKGAERGGFGTLEDQSVVLGLDAPTGVGSPMGDRIGLVVGADGGARIDLINNETLLPVRLVSDADGSGGLEFFDYDLPGGTCTVTRLDHKGQTKRTVSLEGDK